MKPKLGPAVAKYRLPMGVLSADLSPDGSTLYAACMDGIYELNLADGQSERLDTHPSYVSGVVLLAESRTLVSAGFDGALQWYDLASRQRIRRVEAHAFWSWQLALSPDHSHVASVSGQYLAGGLKYEPAAESEPSVQVFAADSGRPVHQFSHVPPVQSVAFSPDGRFLAAANLMGEVRVWDLDGGEQVASWTTPDFTSWGVIKSHCYIGGIFALQFASDGEHLLAAGMGPMHDPMAGNGRQLWQKFAWRESPPRKLDETHQGESGEGLMETLALHPSGRHFVMAGRLRGGEWNAALFDTESGSLLHSVKTGCRITKALFDAPGERLILVGTQGQPRPQDGKFPAFGRIDVFPLEWTS